VFLRIENRFLDSSQFESQSTNGIISLSTNKLDLVREPARGGGGWGGWVNSQSQLKGISFARVLRFIKNKNLQKKDTYVDGENQAYKIGFHFVYY